MKTAQNGVTWLRRLYWSARSRVAVARAAARVHEVRRSLEGSDALAGKIAVITGAGAGIGRAIASDFARAGAHCILVTIEPEQGNAALEDLRRRGYEAELIVADVSDERQVRSAAEKIETRHSRVDILVNNAGVYFDEDKKTRTSEVPTDLIRKTLAVNLFGVVNMSTALAHLIPNGGRIINVSSVLGRSTFQFDGKSTAYRLSKAALNSYTRSLAADVQPRGIMVDCFHPGWVKTTIGGPDAKIEPHESTHTPLYLATRPASQLTGLFWEDCRSMLW